MFTEKIFDNLGVDMITSNDSEESMEKFAGSIGSSKYQSVITDLGKALLQAARTGNTPKVLDLMGRGAPFTADWLGTTPLHLAARFNHIETCRALLRAGISKDSKTKVDRTPLHMAAYHGNIEIVELLLSNKCEVDAKDLLKMTPLHWAVEKRHDKVVEMLLQHGADPNALSKFDKSPIVLAKTSKQMELVRILKLANELRAASNEQVGVKEATDSLMHELQQHKERHLDGQSAMGNENDEIEDNITMELSNDSNTNLSDHSDHEHHQHPLDDTYHLIEKEDSLSDAIANLEQSTEADPKNLDSSTLQMLKEHGIAFMPADEGGSVITSAIKSGRKIVLSEAGKYALKETRNLHTQQQQQQQHQQHQQQQQQQQQQHHLQKQTFHPTTSIHGANITHTKTKTIKIIKKQSSSSHLHHSHLHHHVHQSGTTGATPTIKTNKVIKILSPEEFKQICGGEVGGIKRVSSSEYKKAVASSSVRVPIGGRSHVIPSSGGSMGPKPISKIVMTKSGQRFPVVGNAAKTVGDFVQTKMGVSSSGSSGIGMANGLSASGHNRHIITSADGVKRIRTAAGMEIISALPTKLPQDTVVSVESSTAPRVGAVIHRVASLANPSSVPSKAISSAAKTASGNLVVDAHDRQLLELKKLIDDLRKQFELSQKQNEEYRARVDKLEKEVQTLKQQQQRSGDGAATGASLVEIL